LVGIRLNITNNWWPGFDDGGFNQSQIAAINVDGSSLYYFQVELDDKPGMHYAMCYDSILLYEDDTQTGFSWFCLPLCCPGNPDNKIV
jgi:hypothetical protein